jgi:uncharacterized protein YbjT (DUF2867 family)
VTHPQVLVVGSTGRVGNLVSRALAARGYKVVCLARDTQSMAARSLETHQGLQIVRGDVTELPSLVAAMVRHRTPQCHLALA